MRSISALLTQPIFQAVGTALLHFLWQGTLVALLVASLNVLLQKRTARARYAVACAGLALMLALPVVTAAFIGSENPPPPAARLPAPPSISNPETIVAASVPVKFGGNSVKTDSWTENSPALMPWLVALWMTGVMVFSLRAAGGWLVVRRLRRRSNFPASENWQKTVTQLATKLRVSRSVRLCESALAEVPAVIGWMRPVILVPVGALTGLSSAQIEAVLAHELAHIRRHDYLVNLLQTVVENLLFYHPAVWWVSRRVRIEREHCCDDLAVAACGDVVLYARALTALEGLRSTTAPPFVLAADGGSLLGRVRRLLGTASSPNRATAWLASLIMLVTLGGIGVGAHHALLPVVAAQASAIRSQVTSMITGRHTAHTGNDRLAVESNHAVPHLAVEVTVPIPSDHGVPSVAAETTADYSEVLETGQDGSDAQDAGAPANQQSPGSFIEEMAAAGYANLAFEELIALKNQGVTGAFIRDLKAAGYDKLPVEQLLALRIHGVTGEYARSMNAAGFGHWEVDQLLASRIHGVTPEYLNEMRGLVKDADFNQLLAFRIHGVTPEFVKEFASFGFGEPTANQLLAARIHGVTGQYIREMQGQGFGKLSWDKILALRIHRVTADYIKRVHDHGFVDATIDQILELKIMGIIKDQEKDQ